MLGWAFSHICGPGTPGVWQKRSCKDLAVDSRGGRHRLGPPVRTGEGPSHGSPSWGGTGRTEGSNVTSAFSLVSAPAGGRLGSLFQEPTTLESRDTGAPGPSLPSCPHVPGEVKQPGPRGTTGLHLAVSPEDVACTALSADLCTPGPGTGPGQALLVDGQCQDRSRRLSGPEPGPGLRPRCRSRIQKPPLFKTAGRRPPERGAAAEGHPPS